ncbi:MAG: trigger factor [Cyclobacteriaceae bacterium]|nr:trigger factor [Cyclobacteriaceae bacterium]
MNITLDKQSSTDGLIKINLTATDYQPKVEEKIRDYARKANIKGFRQGKVPAGVIKKMYGKSILVEEVNHIVSHSVSDYIRDQKLKILGDPMPNQEKAFSIDWDAQKDFEFEFQIGLVEDFTLELSSKAKVKSHTIEVDQKVIDETLEDLKKRFGNTTHPETSSVSDSLYGDIVKSGETDKKGSFITIEKITKKEQKKFIGVKKDDVIEFDIEKVFTDPLSISKTLNIAEEEAKTASGTYVFTVTNISQTEPAQMNQEFFDKVFGKDVVTNETDFIEKIKTTISENYNRETEHLLDHEIQHYFVDNTKITMPEAFLKTWLKNSSQGQVTDEILEKEFNSYKDSLKWDLIKNKIAEEKEIKVESDEVREKAKQFIAEQFGGAAIAAQLGDKLNDIANNYLSGQDGKGENFMKIYNQLRQEKIMKVIKENITVTDKKVTLDEFKKLAEQHRH